MRNGSLHLRCFLGTCSWPQQPHLGWWYPELWAQAAPVFWAPGSCIQLFLGQGTQNLPQLLKLSVAAVELSCLYSQYSHCWICSRSNECHTLPSHQSPPMRYLWAIESEARGFTVAVPLRSGPRPSVWAVPLYTDRLWVSQGHVHTE